MIGELFSVSPTGDFTVKDERVYLVPEFRAILKDKDGPKLMQYVYAVCDYYSPYIRISDEEQRQVKVVSDIWGKKNARVARQDVSDACERYRQMQEHPLMEQYRVMTRMQSKMRSTVEEAVNSSDSSLTPQAILKLSADLNKFTVEIEKLEEMIVEKNKRHGGLSKMRQNLSIYEQKRYREQVADNDTR